MRYLKLFENHDLSYEQISTNDFLEQHNVPGVMIRLDDYDFNFIENFIKKIPNSLIKRIDNKVISKSGLSKFEYIEISFSNIKYSHIKVYKTETNFYTQIFEPILHHKVNWEFNYYKLDDVWDVMQFIKDKLKLYNKYSVNEMVELKSNDIVETIDEVRYNELKTGIIYLEKGLLGYKTKEFIYKKVQNIFNSKFIFKNEYSYYITIYKNRIAFCINLLEDDYYLVKFKSGEVVIFFICDGIKGLLKLIKERYEQLLKSKPKLYYEINRSSFNSPENNLTVDNTEIHIDRNSEEVIKKLETYLKDIPFLSINTVGRFNYGVSIKNSHDIEIHYFEIYQSSEYDWWLLSCARTNLNVTYRLLDSFYLCITMEGLKQFIEDKNNKIS
jgi:hypothetical protein